MTKRPKPVLVLDVERLRGLLCASDPQTRQLAEAIGMDLNKAVDLLNGLIVPYKEPPKNGGAPTKWGQTEQLCAWLAVETEVRLMRIAEPGIGYKAAMQKFFGRGRPLRTCLQLAGGGDRLLEIKTVNTAVENHREGAKILKRDPDLAEKYEDILKIEIKNEVERRRSPAE